MLIIILQSRIDLYWDLNWKIKIVLYWCFRCDCVGILKERNVDVEHRFPDQTTSRSKKKSTRCRMVFRATIVNDDGTPEVLQVTSQPIVCSTYSPTHDFKMNDS